MNHINSIRGLDFLLGLASLVIVIAGIKLSQEVVLPLLLALFISILSMPLLFWFKSKKLPDWLSLIFILGLWLCIFTIFGTIVAVSATDLVNNLPFYQSQLKIKIGLYYTQLETLGFSVETINLKELINPSKILQYISTGVAQISSIFTKFILLLILVAFMLLEVSKVYGRFQEVSENKNLEKAMVFIGKINRYVAIKTVISALTGLCVSVSLLMMGIHYPILWGLVTFILNFVPNIGSIISAVPAIILAVIQYDLLMGFWVFLVHLCINFVIGNVMEPNYMGGQLGLSPLVVIVSLMFWGWLLGSVGMFLSVPLTIILKFAFESSESTEWMARLMEE